jgi:hypothetical protein
VEQEKKWIMVIKKLIDKINYFKELCKSIIQQKSKHLSKVESINDTLFAKRVTAENLENHKKLIHELLNVINEKRDQIYLLKSEKEILEKELKFWIFDFDKIKICPQIRDSMKQLQLEKLVKNIYEEFSHKK